MNTTEPFICNAVIESAEICDSDRGLLDCWLTLNYGDGGVQGFGGYALYLPKSFTHHRLESVAGHHIWRCMEIAEVKRWSDMKGRTIRVRKEGKWGGIRAIGHIVKDDWYCADEDFAALRERA